MFLLLHFEPDFVCLFSVDIWSVGCIMAELLTGQPTFAGTDRILREIYPNIGNKHNVYNCYVIVW